MPLTTHTLLTLKHLLIFFGLDKLFLLCPLDDLLYSSLSWSLSYLLMFSLTFSSSFSTRNFLKHDRPLTSWVLLSLKAWLPGVREDIRQEKAADSVFGSNNVFFVNLGSPGGQLVLPQYCWGNQTRLWLFHWRPVKLWPLKKCIFVERMAQNAFKGQRNFNAHAVR